MLLHRIYFMCIQIIVIFLITPVSLVRMLKIVTRSLLVAFVPFSTYLGIRFTEQINYSNINYRMPLIVCNLLQWLIDDRS